MLYGWISRRELSRWRIPEGLKSEITELYVGHSVNVNSETACMSAATRRMQVWGFSASVLLTYFPITCYIYCVWKSIHVYCFQAAFWWVTTGLLRIGLRLMQPNFCWPSLNIIIQTDCPAWMSLRICFYVRQLSQNPLAHSRLVILRCNNYTDMWHLPVCKCNDFVRKSLPFSRGVTAIDFAAL